MLLHCRADVLFACEVVWSCCLADCCYPCRAQVPFEVGFVVKGFGECKYIRIEYKVYTASCEKVDSFIYVRVEGLVKLRTHSRELLLAHEVAHSFKQVFLSCMAKKYRFRNMKLLPVRPCRSPTPKPDSSYYGQASTLFQPDKSCIISQKRPVTPVPHPDSLLRCFCKFCALALL